MATTDPIEVPLRLVVDTSNIEQFLQLIHRSVTIDDLVEKAKALNDADLMDEAFAAAVDEWTPDPKVAWEAGFRTGVDMLLMAAAGDPDYPIDDDEPG